MHTDLGISFSIKGELRKEASCWKVSIPLLGFHRDCTSSLSCLREVEAYFQSSIKTLDKNFRIQITDNGVFQVSTNDSKAVVGLIAEAIAKGEVSPDKLQDLLEQIAIDLGF